MTSRTPAGPWSDDDPIRLIRAEVRPTDDSGARSRSAIPSRRDLGTVSLVGCPRLTMPDLVGAFQVLIGPERFPPQYRAIVVGSTTSPMATDVGVQVVPDRTSAELPRPYAVIVPGATDPAKISAWTAWT